MIIELSDDELLQLFGKDVTGSKFIKLNSVDFKLEGYDCWTDSTTHFGYRVVYRLYLQQTVVKPKSPQEIAAEEAVQKAESALKAAKDVLNKVKEN